MIRPLKQFEDGLRTWAQTGGPLRAALAYKVYILPVLLFVVQLEDLPPSWPDYEQKAIQRLFPGHWKWLPLGIARNLKLLGFPLEVPDLEIMVSAIRLRAARDLEQGVRPSGPPLGAPDRRAHYDPGGPAAPMAAVVRRSPRERYGSAR